MIEVLICIGISDTAVAPTLVSCLGFLPSRSKGVEKCSASVEEIRPNLLHRKERLLFFQEANWIVAREVMGVFLAPSGVPTPKLQSWGGD